MVRFTLARKIATGSQIVARDDDAAPPKKARKRSGGSEGRGFMPRVPFGRLRRVVVASGRQRYMRLHGSGNRPRNQAVAFVEAAASIMRDMRKAIAIGLGIVPDMIEIERDQRRAAQARAFHRAALEMQSWRELWEEQRRRAAEAAQLPNMRAGRPNVLTR